MNTEITSVREAPSDQVRPQDAVERSRQAWRRLGMRLRSITPGGLMRFLLVVGALLALVWVIRTTWVA